MMKLLERKDLLKMKTSAEIVKVLSKQPWLMSSEVLLYKRELALKERAEKYGEGNLLLYLIDKKVEKD